MKVGDKYIYCCIGASDKDPWIVEIVKVYEKQVAYCWVTGIFNELHASSNLMSHFLKEFREETAEEKLKQIKEGNRELV